MHYAVSTFSEIFYVSSDIGITLSLTKKFTANFVKFALSFTPFFCPRNHFQNGAWLHLAVPFQF
jgi:hypothetical protein